ncbi:MAG: YhbY family RNA-binding protein [Betaproteobacteria bacterium]|nr:YhbY family RNA-binding protein [Betaproteobacteria bacterium]
MTESKNDEFKADETVADELTPVERRALRARAHALEPVVLVGDKGLTGAVLTEIERALAVHELIKIRVQAERDQRRHFFAEICASTKASPVQHIGKVLLIYRKKPPEPPKPAVKTKAPRPAPRKSPTRKPPQRKPLDRAAFGRPRRPSTATGHQAVGRTRRQAAGGTRQAADAARGTGRPESRTASPHRAPARPPGRRRTSR